MNTDSDSTLNVKSGMTSANDMHNGKKSSAFVRLCKLIWRNIRERAQIKEDTDIETTICSITKSTEFRGVNIWILAFATIVASIGLNINSTAVIIGAMLISPLMGPINGDRKSVV